MGCFMPSLWVGNFCEREHTCQPHQVCDALEGFEIQLFGESGCESIGEGEAENFARADVRSALHGLAKGFCTRHRLYAQADYGCMQFQVRADVRCDGPKDRALIQSLVELQPVTSSERT